MLPLHQTRVYLCLTKASIADTWGNVKRLLTRLVEHDVLKGDLARAQTKVKGLAST